MLQQIISYGYDLPPAFSRCGGTFEREARLSALVGATELRHVLASLPLDDEVPRLTGASGDAHGRVLVAEPVDRVGTLTTEVATVTTGVQVVEGAGFRSVRRAAIEPELDAVLVPVRLGTSHPDLAEAELAPIIGLEPVDLARTLLHFDLAGVEGC